LEELDDGVDEDEDDGVLEEPAPAAPPVELEGEELEDELAPPLAGLLVVSLELDEELDGEDELAPGVVAPEDDALPDGELDGELVVPLAEDAEPDGEVVEPDGAVDEELEDLSAPGSWSSRPPQGSPATRCRFSVTAGWWDGDRSPRRAQPRLPPWRASRLS